MSEHNGNGSGRWHLHCVESDALGPLYTLSPDMVGRALAARPMLKDKLRITFSKEGEPFSDDALGADTLFGWTFDHRSLKGRMKNLKLFQVFGAGANHFYPLDWLPERCQIANCIGVHGPRAGEYIIMSLLMLNNRMPEMATAQRASQWGSYYTGALVGKTVLIIGVGNLGKAGAEWAKKFGMKVLGIRRSGEPYPAVDEMHLPEDLHTLLPQADFLVLTAPATDDTRAMIGREELSMLKEGAGLVNFARSDLVDYEALRKDLIEGRRSAILDVFDEEPLPSSSNLWDTPNLIMTFHCCSDDPTTFVPGSFDLLLGNIERVMAGKEPKNRVDPTLGY